MYEITTYVAGPPLHSVGKPEDKTVKENAENFVRVGQRTCTSNKYVAANRCRFLLVTVKCFNFALI